MPRLNLADHHVRAGDLVEARELIEEVHRIQPALTADHVFEVGIAIRSTDPEGFRRNLQTAGLP